MGDAAPEGADGSVSAALKGSVNGPAASHGSVSVAVKDSVNGPTASHLQPCESPAASHDWMSGGMRTFSEEVASWRLPPGIDASQVTRIAIYTQSFVFPIAPGAPLF